MSLQELQLCVCGHPRHMHTQLWTRDVGQRPAIHYGDCKGDSCKCPGFLENRSHVMSDPDQGNQDDRKGDGAFDGHAPQAARSPGICTVEGCRSSVRVKKHGMCHHHYVELVWLPSKPVEYQKAYREKETERKRARDERKRADRERALRPTLPRADQDAA